MNPAREKYYRGLFNLAAIYDVLLGIAFTFFPARAFAVLGISEKLPAFGGYLTLLGTFAGDRRRLLPDCARRFAAERGFDSHRHALQTGLRGDGLLLLVAGQPAARCFRRAVRRGRRGIFYFDGGMLLVFGEEDQRLKPFAAGGP